jgi:hypothetical protein
MADGKQWTTDNLNVNTPPSYCYEDSELKRRRGRVVSRLEKVGDSRRTTSGASWQSTTAESARIPTTQDTLRTRRF